MEKIALILGLCCLTKFSLAETTLIINVNGYTLKNDRELIQFTALQFTDDRIDRLYSANDEFPTDVETIINGDGRTMIPGLIDAHGHIGSYGFSLLRVDLVGSGSEQEAA